MTSAQRACSTSARGPGRSATLGTTPSCAESGSLAIARPLATVCGATWTRPMPSTPGSSGPWASK
eukprot:37990-Lingulodinium_polyedra.AAC.1